MDAVAQKLLSGYLLCPQKVAALGAADVAPVENLRLADQFVVHGGRNPLFVSARAGSSFLGKRSLGARGRLNIQGVPQDLDLPSSMALARIDSEEQFDRIIAEAQHHGELLIIVWFVPDCALSCSISVSWTVANFYYFLEFNGVRKLQFGCYRVLHFLIASNFVSIEERKKHAVDPFKLAGQLVGVENVYI